MEYVYSIRWHGSLREIACVHGESSPCSYCKVSDVLERFETVFGVTESYYVSWENEPTSLVTVQLGTDDCFSLTTM
jgi:hypothetical protein